MADAPEDVEVLPASVAPSVPAPRADDRAVGPVDALSAYMAELAKYAPISREEEHELALRWVEERDVEAARRLVLSNLRLVVKIAMEYRRAWTNTLDLIQDGNLGLLEAVQRFDPHQDVKLSTYAAYWIRAYILKYILDNFRIVRLGTTRAQRKLFFRLNKEKRTLERQGFDVEPKLLADCGATRAAPSSATSSRDRAPRPSRTWPTSSCAACSSRRCTTSPRRSTSATAGWWTSASWHRNRGRWPISARSWASRANGCASSRRAS
jgi:RNA polymerase sigma factor (sigma-70 family)